MTIGGSICAEFLTSSGWNSTFTVPAVLLMCHMTLIEATPRAEVLNAKTHLQPYPHLDYTYEEAREAFERLKSVHGWK